MRLVGLSLLAMVAFAANSVLNRWAVGGGLIDPVGFALIRLAAGALMLSVLLVARHWFAAGPMRAQRGGRVAGVLGLMVYLLGFSVAYLALDAGVGALILFGVVQMTMFGGAVLAREAVPRLRWLGALLAFAGLVLLLAPGGGAASGTISGAVSLPHAAAMAMAGIGWGIYSLAGRGQVDALAATAANFVLALPLGLLVLLVMPMGHVTAEGAGLAVVSGAVTSGIGYALWYSVVPRLGAARAGVLQLSVPLIAALGGVLLGEAVGLRFVLAAGLVLAGVALGMVQSGRIILTRP